MRVTGLLLLFFVCTHAVGQQTTATAKKHAPVLYSDSLNHWVDSFKAQILADTIKFREADLVFTAAGRRNVKPYSPLFIVNRSYMYKLDIVPGAEVAAFVQKILDPRKIRSIEYFDSSKSRPAFGSDGNCGVVMITMLDKASFNPGVAGLALYKNNTGNNFTTRKQGELFIRE